MAYSYIPIGSTGEEYDILASDIGNKVFFAGEVWFKHRVSNIEAGVFCKVFNSKRGLAFLGCLHQKRASVYAHFEITGDSWNILVLSAAVRFFHDTHFFVL